MEALRGLKVIFFIQWIFFIQDTLRFFHLQIFFFISSIYIVFKQQSSLDSYLSLRFLSTKGLHGSPPVQNFIECPAKCPQMWQASNEVRPPQHMLGKQINKSKLDHKSDHDQSFCKTWQTMKGRHLPPCWLWAPPSLSLCLQLRNVSQLLIFSLFVF